jgi:putative transposase
VPLGELSGSSSLPWENGYRSGSNGQLSDKHASREIFSPLGDTQIIIESWRKHHNTKGTHGALG